MLWITFCLTKIIFSGAEEINNAADKKNEAAKDLERAAAKADMLGNPYEANALLKAANEEAYGAEQLCQESDLECRARMSRGRYRPRLRSGKNELMLPGEVSGGFTGSRGGRGSSKRGGHGHRGGPSMGMAGNDVRLRSPTLPWKKSLAAQTAFGTPIRSRPRTTSGREIPRFKPTGLGIPAVLNQALAEERAKVFGELAMKGVPWAQKKFTQSTRGRSVVQSGLKVYPVYSPLITTQTALTPSNPLEPINTVYEGQLTLIGAPNKIPNNQMYDEAWAADEIRKRLIGKVQNNMPELSNPSERQRALKSIEEIDDDELITDIAAQEILSAASMGMNPLQSPALKRAIKNAGTIAEANLAEAQAASMIEEMPEGLGKAAAYDKLETMDAAKSAAEEAKAEVKADNPLAKVSEVEEAGARAAAETEAVASAITPAQTKIIQEELEAAMATGSPSKRLQALKRGLPQEVVEKMEMLEQAKRENAMLRQQLIEEQERGIADDIATKKEIADAIKAREQEREELIVKQEEAESVANTAAEDAYTEALFHGMSPSEASRAASEAFNKTLGSYMKGSSSSLILTPDIVHPSVVEGIDILATDAALKANQAEQYAKEAAHVQKVAQYNAQAAAANAKAAKEEAHEVAEISKLPPPALIAGTMVEEENLKQGIAPEVASMRGAAVAQAVTSEEALKSIAESKAAIEEARMQLSPEDRKALESQEEVEAIKQGFVPAEVVENLNEEDKKLIKNNEDLILDMARENLLDNEEKAQLEESLESAPANWAESAARRLQKAQESAIGGTESLLGESPETRQEELGIIATIPDNAEEVELKNASLQLPLKTFTDNEAENDAEAEAQEAQDSLRNDLRNKITDKKFDSPLNVLKGEDGYLYIPENAEAIDVIKGKVIFPEGMKESLEKAGQDASMLEHKINVGENGNIAEGLGYYEADASGMKLKLPTPLTPNLGTVLTGPKGNLDISHAQEMKIEEGKLQMTPWTDYSRRVRPNINQAVKVSPERSAEEQKVYEEAAKAAEMLGGTQTQLFENPGGNEFVEVKPPFGVTQHIPMEEVIESLSGAAGGEEGQEVIGQLRGMTGEEVIEKMEKQHPKAMNLLEEEEMNTQLAQKYQNSGFSEIRTGQSAGFIPPITNAFNGAVSEEKMGIFGQEQPQGLTEEQRMALVEEVGKERAKVVESVYENLRKKAKPLASNLNITEDEFFSAIDSLPPHVVSEFVEYSSHPLNKEQASIHENAQMQIRSLFPGKPQIIEDAIFSTIGSILGTPNPKKIRMSKPKRLAQIKYDKPNGGDRKVKQLIYTDDVTEVGPGGKKIRHKGKKRVADQGVISYGKMSYDPVTQSWSQNTNTGNTDIKRVQGPDGNVKLIVRDVKSPEEAENISNLPLSPGDIVIPNNEPVRMARTPNVSISQSYSQPQQPSQTGAGQHSKHGNKNKHRNKDKHGDSGNTQSTNHPNNGGQEFAAQNNNTGLYGQTQPAPAYNQTIQTPSAYNQQSLQQGTQIYNNSQTSQPMTQYYAGQKSGQDYNLYYSTYGQNNYPYYQQYSGYSVSPQSAAPAVEKHPLNISGS